MSLLSASGIRRHMAWGSIVINPFDVKRLGTNSYDLELGPWFWRMVAEDPLLLPKESIDNHGLTKTVTKSTVSVVGGKEDGR